MTQRCLIAIFLFFASPVLVAQPEPVSGKVLETKDVGNYIYVLIEGQDRWVATSPLELQVGDTIQYSGGNLMKNFYSSKLDQTFDEIVFVSKIKVIGQENHPDSMIFHNNSHHLDQEISAENGVMEPVEGEIAQLEGSASIGELLINATKLNGKKGSLRAKVMKFSLDILGKNWVTLQDGTGESPDNVLIATTNEDVVVGEIVVVEGIFNSDVDIGSGYKYKLILGEATFSKP